MRKILIITSVFLILASCSKSGIYFPPDNITIDINNDSINDFEIDYMSYASGEIPPMNQGVICRLFPLNDNQILYQQSTEYCLFLRLNDTIKRENNTQSIWHDNPVSLIHLDGDDDKWEDEWNVFYSEQKSIYYVGLKIQDSIDYIGWMSMRIDFKRGYISIVDKEMTSSDEIIIK